MTAPNTNASPSAPTFLFKADPAYIKAAIECGFGAKDTISRAECLAIRAKTGLRLPRWLMKDPARRTERGTYHCPELFAEEANANNAAFNEGTINA
jgi:hypothetical protein